MTIHPDSVTTLEQLSNYIDNVYQTPLQANSFELIIDNEYWCQEVKAELNRLTHHYPPKTILTPEMMHGLSQLLKKRDQLVAGKALDYPQVPWHQNTLLFLGIAQILRKIYDTHPIRLLMPSLVNVYNLITDSDLDDKTQLRDFIRSEDGKTAIYIRECFEYAKYSETLTFCHTTFMDKCLFLTHCVAPSVALLPTLLGDADAAYIQHDSQLFYLHKATNSCTEITITPTQLDALSTIPVLDATNPILSYQALHQLTSLVGHAYDYLPIKPLSEEETYRLINHSDYTKDLYDVLDSLNQLKHRCINFGSILNSVVSGLRSGGVGEVWKKIRLKTQAYTRMDANQVSLHQDILPSTSDSRSELQTKYEKTNAYYHANADINANLTLVHFISWLQGLSNEDRNTLLSYEDVTSAISKLMRLPTKSFIVALSEPLTTDKAKALLNESNFKPIYARYAKQLFILNRYPELGYQLCLTSDLVEPNNLYISNIDNVSFSYQVLDTTNNLCAGTITLSELQAESIITPLTLETLQRVKYHILKVTSARGHTATHYWRDVLDFASDAEKFNAIVGHYDTLRPLPLQKVVTLHLLINAISPERNNNPDCVQLVADALEKAVKQSPKLYELNPTSKDDLSQDDSFKATYTALMEMHSRVRQDFDEAINLAQYKVKSLPDARYQLDVTSIIPSLLLKPQALKAAFKKASYNQIVSFFKVVNIHLLAAIDWSGTFYNLPQEKIAALRAMFCQEKIPPILQPIYNMLIQVKPRSYLSDNERNSLRQYFEIPDVLPYIKVILSDPFTYQLAHEAKESIFTLVKHKLPTNFANITAMLSYCANAPHSIKVMLLCFYRQQIYSLIRNFDDLKHALTYYNDPIRNPGFSDDYKLECAERTDLLTFFRGKICPWISTTDELKQAIAYYSYTPLNDDDKAAIFIQFIERNNLPFTEVKRICSELGINMRKIFIEKSNDYQSAVHTIASFSFSELMAYFKELYWLEGDEITFMKSINSHHFQAVTSNELHEFLQNKLSDYFDKRVKLICDFIQHMPLTHILELTKEKPAIIQLLLKSAEDYHTSGLLLKLLFNNIPDALQHYIQEQLTTPDMIFTYLKNIRRKNGEYFFEQAFRHLAPQTLLPVFTKDSDIKALFDLAQEQGLYHFTADSCKVLDVLIKGKAHNAQEFLYFFKGKLNQDGTHVSWHNTYFKSYFYNQKNDIFPVFHETIKTIIKSSIHKTALQKQFTPEFISYFKHSIPDQNNIILLKIIHKLELKTQILMINNLSYGSELAKLLKFNTCVNLLTFLQLFFDNPILPKCLAHIIGQKTFTQLIKSDGQLSQVLNFTPPNLLLSVLKNVNLLQLITTQQAMDKVLKKLKTESGQLLSNDAYNYFHVTIAPNMSKIHGSSGSLLEHEERLLLTDIFGEPYADCQDNEMPEPAKPVINKLNFFQNAAVDTKQMVETKMPRNLRRSM